MRHFVSNPVIEGDGDQATMKLYVEVKNLADEAKPLLVGCYHDELRRVDGRWKFARRVVEVDYRAGQQPRKSRDLRPCRCGCGG